MRLAAFVAAAALLELAAGTLSARASLDPGARRSVAAAVGAPDFRLDCTYAARGQQGLALPAWNGLPARAYVRPWICATLNRAVRGRWRGADADGAPAMAALVLAHEAVHLSPFPGARDERATECRALALLPAVLAALGAPAAMLPRLEDWARQAHEALLASSPAYGPACDRPPAPVS